MLMTEYMFLSSSVQESLVLGALESGGSLTIEEVIASLPELTWNEVFNAIDRLSRNGTITLRRHGFGYELSLSSVGRRLLRAAAPAGR
jgi:DNA-binding transcriptional regulator PaaX